MTAPLNPADNRVGRYTGPARIVFQGDQSICARYVTLGRNVLGSLRHSLALGGINEGMRGASVNGVSILAMHKGGIDQIFINASGGGAVSAHQLLGGYQFYTTSPVVKWAIWDDPSDFCPGGSVIYAPTPVFPKNKNPLVDDITEEELAAVKIFSHPTCSLVEPVPTITGADGTTRNECPSFDMPTQVSGVNPDGLNQIMQKKAFRINDTWQINGVAQYDNHTSEYDVNTNYEKLVLKTNCSWEQMGQLNFDAFGIGNKYKVVYNDIFYDIAPSHVKGRSNKWQMPDADWPYRSSVIKAVSEQYGTRVFIIMHTANDDWWCWPALGSGLLDTSLSDNPPVEGQAYKANVPAKYAKRVRPLYPSWVCTDEKLKRDKDTDPGIVEPFPRYTFSFSSDGKKAVAAMVERTPIAEDVFYKTDFMEPESGLPHTKEDWRNAYMREYFGYGGLGWSHNENIDGSGDASAAEYYDPGFSDYAAPIESKTGVKVTVDPSLGADPEMRGPFSYDRRGIVEITFDVQISGPNPEDFSFSATVGTTKSPAEIAEFECGALVDVAYAKATISHPRADNMSDFSYRTAQIKTVKPEKDEIVTAFMTLYRSNLQEKFDVGFGQCSNGSISKGKTSFYKGEDYQTNNNSLFELPIIYRYGRCYAKEGTDPYEDVEFSYSSVDKDIRPFNDTRPQRYFYDAKLAYMDLSTLSFVYTLAVLEPSIEATPNEEFTDTSYYFYFPEDANYHTVYSQMYREIDRQTELCNVYVFGRIIHESFVGTQGDHNGYLVGLADSISSSWVTNDEQVFPTAFSRYLNDPRYSYDYSEGRSTSFDNWWLSGMCGMCILMTIEDSFKNRDYSCVYQDHVILQPPEDIVFDEYDKRIYKKPFSYALLGTNSDGTRRPNITEEEAKDLLRYAIKTWGEFIAGNIQISVPYLSTTRQTLLYPSPINAIVVGGMYADDSYYRKREDYGYSQLLLSYFHTVSYSEGTHTQHKVIYNMDYTPPQISNVFEDFPIANNPVAEVIDVCSGKVNPFSLAREGFDVNDTDALDGFIDRCAFVMMELCNLITELKAEPKFTDYNAYGRAFWSFSTASTGLGSSKFQTSTGTDFSSTTVFDISELGPVENIIRIKNFDWGNHLYNDFLKSRFSPDALTGTYGSILTTLDGHYSYQYKSHYCLNQPYSAVARSFTIGLNRVYPVSYLDEDIHVGTTPWVGNPDRIDKSWFDWKCVEGVGWYWGLIKTTHLDLYNMAFDEGWRNGKRGDGKEVCAVASELPIATKYTYDDFKPDFDVMTKTIYPYPYKCVVYFPNTVSENQYIFLDREMNKKDNNPFVVDEYPYTLPGNSDKQFLRLSPFFF